MPLVPPRTRNARDYTVTLKIECPSLDKLVDYLNSHDEDQKKIDALAATVEAITAKLHQSSAGLGKAVADSAATKP